MGSSTAGDACASSSSGPSTSASAAADAGATHYLAKRVLRGSAVLHVAEGCFAPPIPWTSSSARLVFLSPFGLLTRPNSFFAIVNIELSKPGNLRHQLGRILAIDRESCFVAVSAHEDTFALIHVSVCQSPHGSGRNFEDLPLHNFRNIFIHQKMKRMQGLKGSDVNDLSLFGRDSSSGIVNHISSYSETGPLALDITEIPEMFGFALLFRVGDVLLLDLTNPINVSCIRRISLMSSLFGDPVSIEHASPGVDDDDDEAACALLELSDSGNNIMQDEGYMDIDGVDSRGNVKSRIVSSWSWEPPDPVRRGWARLLFCLDDGEFHTLEFTLDVEGVKLYMFEYIDRGLPCKPLLWMKNRMIIGFVEMGDGMIFKLGHRRLLHKSTIQNVAPILDLAIADYHGEKQDQMFACCGMCPEGSLRVLRNGVNVEKLLSTEATYQGVTGLWTLRMKITDVFHSFLVLSFVEETRILSVGLSFNDISDAVGFQPDVCTLACGLVDDGLLVQIHSKGVKLCLPTLYAHPEGAPLTSPVCTNWCPDVSISVGAVVHNIVIVATSNPCCLYILGVRSSSSFQYELYETQHVQLQYEISCISIPRGDCTPDNVASNCAEGNDRPAKVDVQRFVAAEKFYILAGLRNGMLLRFESEASEHYFPGSFYKDLSNPFVNTILQLISIRRIGITPVVLVPMHDSASADIIVLSDRPWLLHAARHSLAYSSISFLPASHVTPVSSVDCPNGLLFVAENCLHLVEMVHGKRLNAQKFSIGGTPRKVLYHSESRSLLVLRTGLSDASCFLMLSNYPVDGSNPSSSFVYCYQSLRKLELIYSDPAQRLVGDVALLNCETAVVSDRRGSISVLSCTRLEVSESPQKNLAAAFRYRLPIDDDTEPVLESAYNCVVASTLLGSVFVMIPLTSEEHELLQDIQERLSVHPLTAPVLGNDHAEFRQRGIPPGVPPILDGDMLVQFLELTGEQQEAILTHASSGKGQRRPVSVFQVLRTLERVHYALN
ncbi:hypothetical protein PR202_gb12622 [Eleusine coracana subsp. coracana]|uniref:Uncharacterized protein n=1 Tax=Eleusine coracana subsp. coracana TaxID=191504 RepID=A0AAV5EN90_ELECO|nr:hypothetical protein PR202_gb12622 [Eleusine coracana subsp. coracana]